MLFLLNERVLDLGDPALLVQARGWGDLARMPRMAVAVREGQEAAFASHNFEKAHPDLMARVAVQLALASEANCALFVAPPRARAARDVGVQFAYAPLTTLVYLLSLQEKGALNAAIINREVWRLVRGRASA